MKCSRLLTYILFLSFSITVHGQELKRKNFFPIWTFHQNSINLHGISLGIWTWNEEPRLTHTNGIRIELIGLGFGTPLIPKSPIVETESAFLRSKEQPISERVNGLNLSGTGSVCNCRVNGITAGFIGQILFQVNGISASLVMNLAQKHNGLMVAIFNDAYYMHGLQVGLGNNAYKTKGAQAGLIANYAEEMRGIQIGLFNKSEYLKGIQLGLWNVNQRRKFPIVNCCFKSNKQL